MWLTVAIVHLQYMKNAALQTRPVNVKISGSMQSQTIQDECLLLKGKLWDNMLHTDEEAVMTNEV